MCEESTVSYNHGDVVWVKLGPCWWPGEIVSFEELPSDITESFKKAPLAAVKFFDEEKYEFIRQKTHIHLYNSNKKYEFIKKGLDLHRAKNAFMDKFPKDVCTAETKTNGDPNILNDPKVGPDKKLNYSTIFGSPVSKKKGSKDSPNRSKNKNSTGRHSLPNSSKQKERFITHPRFLGKDDSEIRILVQTPSTITKPPESEYECYACGFKSSRIDVIFLHNKYHLKTSCTSSHSQAKRTKKSPSKRPKKRPRMPTSKTTSIDEDLALLRQGLPVCSDHTTSEESSSESDEEPLVKRKPKPKSPPKPKKIKTPPAPEVKKQTDIRTDLLAEWDDDEDDEEPPKVERISPKPVASSAESKTGSEPTKSSDEKDKSCFDFVEDEEDLLTALEGRKIPRVIPPTDKRKSIQDRDDEERVRLSEEVTLAKSRSPSPKNSEDSVIESESEKPKESNEAEMQIKIDENDVTKKKESQFQLEFEAFNNALRETTVPTIIDIPPLTKYEQNFHDVKTIKFPDKPDAEPNESKVAFPTPPNNENTKIDESKQLEINKIETVVEPVPEPTKEPVVRKTEVATKLTNPKKRFVKTFEDETKNSTRGENVVVEKKKEPSPEPVKKELKSLEVSKLKTQLMRKLEASPKKENIKQPEKSKKSTYKGKRSKILPEKSEPVKSKDSKRIIVESVSDHESKTRAKKKRYSAEEGYSENDHKQVKTEAISTQKPVSSRGNFRDKTTKDHNISESETNNVNQLEYLNSSPTKIFRELHVDKDELMDVGSLSESQKLTIQNIIGVTSSMSTVQQSPSDKSNLKEEKPKVEHTFTSDGSERKDLIEDILKTAEIESQEKSDVVGAKVEAIKVVGITEEQKEGNKSIFEVTDETQKETCESSMDHVGTTTQLYQLDEKLSARISEKLPDEIIEEYNTEIMEDLHAKEERGEIVGEKLNDAILDKTIAEIEKPADENEVFVEEKISTLPEKHEESCIQELSEEPIPEEEIEISQSKKTENDTEDDVDVENVEELESKSKILPKEILNDFTETRIQEKVDTCAEELESLKPEIISGNEADHKSEESKDESIEKVEEEKVEEMIVESVDTPMYDEDVADVRVEKRNDNIDVASNNLTIDRQNESDLSPNNLIVDKQNETDVTPNDLAIGEQHGTYVPPNDIIMGKHESDIGPNDLSMDKHENDVDPSDLSVNKHETRVAPNDLSMDKHEADVAPNDLSMDEHETDVSPNQLSMDKQNEVDFAPNNLDKDKQNETDIAPGNLTIDKQNEIPVNVDKEDGTSTNDDIKSDFHLPLESLGKNTSDLVKSMFQEEELVNIEGNLTVVTETDLADKQVEIATTPEVSKPITLTNFSMDFCDDVESYVKAETIMQNFSSTRDGSPIDEVVKDEVKDAVLKDATTQENAEGAGIGAEDKVESMDIYQNEAMQESNRITKDDNVKLMLDIKNEEKAKNEGTELKKFDNVITPAKDVPPAVIMEGFEEVLKEEEDDLSIDEPNLKVQIDTKRIQKPNLTLDTTMKTAAKEEAEKSNSANKRESGVDVKQIPEQEEIIVPAMDISVESEVAKITDSIVERETEAEVMIKDSHRNTSSTKLLEILTDRPKSNNAKPPLSSPASSKIDESPATPSKITHKPKFLTKQTTPSPSKSIKANILSDKLIKPLDESKTVSVKKVTSKRSYQDVEDIDTYIIQKPVKKLNVSVESDTKIMKKSPVVSKGKARILQQTIITPTGDILQPPVSQSQADDNMFDINSMPIVLSDQILTPESLENMQIVLQENTATTKPQISPIRKQTPVTQQQLKLLNKTQMPASAGLKETILKTPPIQKQIQINKQKMQKVYPSTPKIIKHNPSVITQPGKQGKFIIVPATTTATGTKYTVGKRPAIVKKPAQKIVPPVTKTPEVPMTSGGNKIMILKGQGQQQKILLTTPQKQLPQTKVKGRAIHKHIIAKESPQQKGPNIISQTILNSKGQVTSALQSASSIGSRGQIIASISQQNRNIKIDPTKMKRTQHQQRIGIQSEIGKPSTSGQQRTIIIRNPQGQTVKKIQGTDDALLDQQVAEQLQAISRASANQQLKDMSARAVAKLPAKKPYMKKHEVKISKNMMQSTQPPGKNVSIPPLAPISPAKKVESHYTEPSDISIAEDKADEPKRQPHQLVIQDAQGNQTTITEGQILALPSEAIEGQPHSYVLVTLDETGNLTPLNSEALMSLDPNLNLTSDLGNMVLQIDQGVTPEPDNQVSSPQRVVAEQLETTNPQNLLLKESADKASAENVLLSEPPATEASDQNVQAVINSGEMGQLIITGDAATAQKFLESLAEGNADLANLLANAEGNVLIQADGQQILINTDSENPMLVMNPENISSESSEGSGNPIFASQPVKNQDILAAALADTDVFQQDQSISHSPSKVVAQSQLSPNSSLYPMNVGNVLETNSMNSPIMTPLEVPSTNSKKIDDENEILTQVPKNVDLPITITDPNISQTVAQQQVASLMATELSTNLDLPLAIQDPGLSATSTEMNSPSFVYSLPTLDDTVDINQKAFSGSISMPLLTEEPEEAIAESSNEGTKEGAESKDKKSEGDKKSVEIAHDKSPEGTDVNKSDSREIEPDEKKTDFINSEGLCAMRGGICNSLSEPPPDMFDFSIENQPYETPHITQNTDMDIPIDSTPSSELSNALNDRESSVSSVEERKNDEVALYTANTSPSTNTDDSCEIPVQPPIIAKPFEENGTVDSRFGEEEDEKAATSGNV